MTKLLEDSRHAAQLFFWNGPIPQEDLSGWLKSKNLQLPEDLVSLWLRVGGGDLFETETIFSPFGDSQLGDNVDEVNRLHHSQGLAEDFFVFHGGLYLSAVRLSDGCYVALSQDYVPMAEYSSLEDWYNGLRSEYAESYGL